MIDATGLRDAIDDLAMKSEICWSLSRMVSTNLDKMKARERLSHPMVVQELNFDQLTHQVYEILVSIKMLIDEIEEA